MTLGSCTFGASSTGARYASIDPATACDVNVGSFRGRVSLSGTLSRAEDYLTIVASGSTAEGATYSYSYNGMTTRH